MEINRRMFSEPSDHSDITFLVQDKRVYVNKGVLAVTSPVFDKMLNGDSKNKTTTEIPLPGKKYDDMIEFLKCIYPSTAKPVSRDNLDLLLPLAEEYQIDSLKDRCDAFIANMVEKKEPNLKELVHLLALGGKYRLENAVKCCVAIASRRKFCEMKQEKEFVDISSEVKYQFTSLQIERYENGVIDLVEDLQKKTKLNEIFALHCSHASKHHSDDDHCTKCRDSFVPNILKSIEKFASK